jgi:DMSO/TMAO reductase YedYZ molybdopterin-dependent catalytic subunit
MTIRRDILKGMAGATVAALAGGVLPRVPRAELPAGTLESAVREALPGKKPLIKRSFRPPNFETPVSYFNELFTPNDAFFVRYHHTGIPQVAADSWRLRVGGESATKSVEFTLAELKRNFEQVEVAAVNQCSGNRRGLFEPHVPGIQWGYGGMGNARWRGVRVKDVLTRAGIERGALEVVFDGADSALLPATPDFVKSLPMAKAIDENTLIAFAMNGKALPHWNGAPARLVVPGWTATYWVKHLSSINVVARPYDGFWMKTAYRIPKGAFPTTVFTSQDTEANTPITDIMVNSLVTNMESARTFKLGEPIDVHGIAWDGGSGIRTVEVSADGGQQWRAVTLGTDAGNFSWRPWRYPFRPESKGAHKLMFRATSKAGATQTSKLISNPAGYHHNLIQALDIVVV